MRNLTDTEISAIGEVLENPDGNLLRQVEFHLYNGGDRYSLISLGDGACALHSEENHTSTIYETEDEGTAEFDRHVWSLAEALSSSQWEESVLWVAKGNDHPDEDYYLVFVRAADGTVTWGDADIEARDLVEAALQTAPEPDNGPLHRLQSIWRLRDLAHDDWENQLEEGNIIAEYSAANRRYVVIPWEGRYAYLGRENTAEHDEDDEEQYDEEAEPRITSGLCDTEVEARRTVITHLSGKCQFHWEQDGPQTPGQPVKPWWVPGNVKLFVHAAEADGGAYAAWAIGDDVAWGIHATTAEATRAAADRLDAYAQAITPTPGADTTVLQRVLPDALRRQAAEAREKA